jgi:excisionase family DNA binding protein
MSRGITTSEAAERLGVSTARVRKLVLDGRLPAEKFGRDLVISEAGLRSFERLKGGRPPKAKPGTVRKRATAKRPRGTGAVTKREREKR